MAADILVVDDEQDIRDLVAGILEDEGYSVRTAADSDQALAAIRERRPSILVQDIWMQGGGLDGLELLDLVKSLDAELPVIMISGHGNIETAVSAIKRGAYDFLEKPFKADRLLFAFGRARLGTGQPEAGKSPPSQTGDCSGRLHWTVGSGPAASATDREGLSSEQPDPDCGASGVWQGTGRPTDPRRQSAKQKRICSNQRRRHDAGSP